jgi:hypothetical protein
MQARQATPARRLPATTPGFLLAELRTLLVETSELPVRGINTHDRASQISGLKKVLNALLQTREIDFETYLSYMQGCSAVLWKR